MFHYISNPLSNDLIPVFDQGLIVTSALVIWKLLMCMTGSESPVVVVLSESMEPAFQRVSLAIFLLIPSH